MRRGLLLAVLTLCVTARAQDGGFTLFADYNCPQAPPCEATDAGISLCPNSRLRRIDCALNGAQGELDVWRPEVKPEVIPPQQGFQLQASHGVISLVVALITTELAVIKSRADQNCKAVANPFAGCH